MPIDPARWDFIGTLRLYERIVFRRRYEIPATPTLDRAHPDKPSSLSSKIKRGAAMKRHFCSGGIFLAGCLLSAGEVSAQDGGERGAPRGTPPIFTISPLTAVPGTVMQITVSPQTPGYELSDQHTTGTMQGAFIPNDGGANVFLGFTFSADDIQVTSDWTAEIIFGAGTPTSIPNLIGVNDTGSLVAGVTLITTQFCPQDVNGSGAVDVNDISYVLFRLGQPGPDGDANEDGIVDVNDLSAVLFRLGTDPCPAQTSLSILGSAIISTTFEAATWTRINYPLGPFGGIVELGSEVGDLPMYLVSILPTIPSENQIKNAGSLHLAVVYEIEENAATLASAPSTITADLISVDSVGVEFSRTEDVVLNRDDNDGNPNAISYVSNLSSPIVLVDIPLVPASYPNLTLLYAPQDGSVFVVPAAN